MGLNCVFKVLGFERATAGPGRHQQICLYALYVSTDSNLRRYNVYAVSHTKSLKKKIDGTREHREYAHTHAESNVPITVRHVYQLEEGKQSERTSGTSETVPRTICGAWQSCPGDRRSLGVSLLNGRKNHRS